MKILSMEDVHKRIRKIWKCALEAHLGEQCVERRTK
jgi:hypothetical protein